MYILTTYNRDSKRNNNKEENNTQSTGLSNSGNHTHSTQRSQLHTPSIEIKPNNKPQLHSGVMLSQFNQSSPIFVSPGQGLQCVANCIISLIYHKNKKCINWKLADIKNILYSGNILYNSIGKFTTILVSDLPKNIKLYNSIYNIQEVNSIIGNVFLDNDNFNTMSFKQVEKIIVKYKYIILILGSSALSIIHYENVFFTFDPHKRNTHGLPDSSGGAAVLKFKSFSQLCSYIHELSLHLCTTDYELTPMIITKYIQPETTVKNSQKFSQQTDTDKYKTMKKTNDTNSKSHRNICTKNSSGQSQHNTTPIETNNDIPLDKHLDNINITQTKISKTITSNQYHHKKTEIIETNHSKLQEQKQNVNKSKENNSKNIAEISKETTSSSESIENITEQKNDNTSRNKIKFKINNISNKIQKNIQTTIDHVYILNFKKLKENGIEQIERQNKTNVNHIQTTNTTNHSTVENNDIKTTYHNLRKRKLQNEQVNNNASKKITKEKQNFENEKYHKLEPSKNKIIPLSHMIILKNEKRNKQTYTTIEKDYKLCKKYGYKFTKICTVCMNDITQTLAILNAKIKLQTKQNTEILLRKELPKNTKLTYKNKTRRPGALCRAVFLCLCILNV